LQLCRNAAGILREIDQRHIWLLRTRHKRPRSGNAIEKYDEFPSPHGFARAEDHIGYEKQYHILD
jgi:hypothetical protein